MLLKRVLFLCTGNYYRSRLAEELFNHRSQQTSLRWQAFSRGLALERGIANVGPISQFTLQALVDRKLVPLNGDAYPATCALADLETSDLVVALKEAEHREILASKFPGWEDRVTYWHVHDVEDEEPAQAIKELEQNVLRLIDHLAETEDTRGA